MADSFAKKKIKFCFIFVFYEAETSLHSSASSAVRNSHYISTENNPIRHQ